MNLENLKKATRLLFRDIVIGSDKHDIGDNSVPGSVEFYRLKPDIQRALLQGTIEESLAARKQMAENGIYPSVSLESYIDEARSTCTQRQSD